MEYERWKKILDEVNSYENLNPYNIIKVIKEKLIIEDKDEYEKWKEEDFGVCHKFCVDNFFIKKAALLHLASYSEQDNLVDNLLKIEGVISLPMLEVLVHKTIVDIGYTTELSTIANDITSEQGTTLEQGSEPLTDTEDTTLEQGGEPLLNMENTTLEQDSKTRTKF